MVFMFQACDQYALKEVKHINFTNPEERYGALVDRFYRLEELQMSDNLYKSDRILAISAQAEILFLMSRELNEMGVDFYDLKRESDSSP